MTKKVHGKMLNVLVKKPDASVMKVPDGLVFPLQTQADIEALKEKLGDRSLMSALASFFLFVAYQKCKFIKISVCVHYSKLHKGYNFKCPVQHSCWIFESMNLIVLAVNVSLFSSFGSHP